MGYKWNPFTGNFDRVDDGSSADNIETVTGDTGGAVGPDSSQNINLLGSGKFSFAGNPGTNTLTLEDDGTLAESYVTDAGTATPSANALNVFGGVLLGTTGSGDTLTINADDNVVGTVDTDADPITPASNTFRIAGGSLVSTSGAGTVVTIDGDASIAASFPTDSGTATPAANALTVTGSTGLNTSGVGSTLTINLDGSVVGQTITGDAGGALSPTSGNWNIFGGTGCATSGSGSTLTINLDAEVPLSFPTQSGTATPAANALTVNGGTLLNSAGAGSTLTLNADDNVVGTVDSDSGSATPTSNAFTIAGGTNINTSASGDTVTINSSGAAAFTWNEVTGTTQAGAVDNGYITNNAGQVDVTLPDTAALGSIIRIVGKGAGGWKVSQNAGETIHFGTSSTTTGVTGSLESTDQRDCVELVCITADTDWEVISSIGNITVN